MNPFNGAGGPMQGPINFIQFMNQHKGQDPNQILNQALSSGRYNQQQLNQAQQIAKQIEGQLNGFRSMFGF